MSRSIITGNGQNSKVEAQVDAAHEALRTSLRPWDHGIGGHYRTAGRAAAVTGTGVVAGGPLFAFQWRDKSLSALILRCTAFWIPTTVFTAAQELGLDMIKATAFGVQGSNNSYSAGANLTPTPMRNGMPASAVTDMRICPATILTAPGTVPTFPYSPIEVGGGEVNVVNAAAGTAYVNPETGNGPIPKFGFDYIPNIQNGEHPLVLNADEGFLIRNTVVFPAAGAATLVVRVVHLEIPKALAALLAAA